MKVGTVSFLGILHTSTCPPRQRHLPMMPVAFIDDIVRLITSLPLATLLLRIISATTITHRRAFRLIGNYLKRFTYVGFIDFSAIKYAFASRISPLRFSRSFTVGASIGRQSSPDIMRELNIFTPFSMIIDTYTPASMGLYS